MGIQAILLAAGASRRFGTEKLLTDLGGQPVVARAAVNLLRGGLSVHCIVRQASGPVARALEGIREVTITECPEANLGLGRSLACGVAVTRSADAWLIALADMPGIAPETIRALTRALDAQASMVAPVYRGRRGHPVGFSRRWCAQLMALQGDRGARQLLADHPLDLRRVPVPDPGVVRDLDYPWEITQFA